MNPGETVLRRYWTGGRITVLHLLRVISDTPEGLRLWLPAGTPYWRILTADGRTQHQAPFEIATEGATLTEVSWQGPDVLVWVPPAKPYSVWWFWNPAGEFLGWYGNLEAPAVRWKDDDVSGFDTMDHALDLWVEPDNSWHWKDLDEFEQRTGHPHYWTADEALAIRHNGDELAALAELAKFPFDRTWTDFQPDRSQPPMSRPIGWDRARALG